MLQLEVEKVVMPKLGIRTKTELAEETSQPYKRLINKHSTIESNINELEHRGLDRCPDRSLQNFTKYISLAVCAYNLKKKGKNKKKRKGQSSIPQPKKGNHGESLKGFLCPAHTKRLKK